MAEVSYEVLNTLGVTLKAAKLAHDTNVTALATANAAVITAEDTLVALSNQTNIDAVAAAKVTLTTAITAAGTTATALATATNAVTAAITDHKTFELRLLEKDMGYWDVTESGGTVTAKHIKTARTFTGTMADFNTLIASL